MFGKVQQDTSYVKEYYNDLQITLVGIDKGHNAELSDKSLAKTLKYASNTGATFGFGLDYRFLTFEYSRDIPGLFNADPAKGTGESFSARFGLTGRKWVFSGLLQSYQGMYIKNPDEIDPSWDTETQGYPHRDDIGSTVVFGSINYYFNAKKYSTLAALWQLNRQLKSAGSVVAGLTIRTNALYADSNVIPRNLNRYFNTDDQFKVGINSSIGINLGYAYNYVFKEKFFASVMFVPGINMQTGNLEFFNGDEISYKSKLGFHGDFRCIIGYNADRYYGGIHYANYYLQHAFDTRLTLGESTTYLRFFVGRRFGFTKHSS